MARYRGPKAKVARRYNSPIFGSSVGKVLQKKIIHQGNMVEDVKGVLNLGFN